MKTALDHLVVIAHTLDEGVAWCETTLGVTPGPGGAHPLMGTHNRLLRIDSRQWPLVYLEIIAIDAAVLPTRAAPLKRWFDMDDAALMHHVRQHGPQLLHWVARTDALEAALAVCRAHGWERGPALGASRMTPEGLLQWRIAVRDDGQRLLDGVLPTLIEWGDVHPVAAMPHSGVALHSLTLRHPQAERLNRLAQAVGLAQGVYQTGAPALAATVRTPKGLVTLA